MNSPTPRGAIGGLALALVLMLSSMATAQPAEGPTTPRSDEVAAADACRELANTSKRLRGQLKNDLRYEIQQDDATFTMKNKKHVVIAYSALLVLLVGFVVLLYLRQQALLAEIARLASEVRVAAAADGGDGGGDGDGDSEE